MTNELVVFVATYLGTRATNALDEALKPLATEVGNDLLRRYRNWKGANLQSVLKKAHAMVPEGQTPVLPTGRILGLVMENASLADEDELQTRYAALLANAFFPGESLNVLPAFPEILRQLTGAHVAILEALHEAYVRQPELRVASQNDIMNRCGLTAAQYVLLAEDLDRLKLVEGGHYVVTRSGAGRTTERDYDFIRITELGLAFVSACTAPSRTSR